jgi:hypothetical protein
VVASDQCENVQIFEIVGISDVMCFSQLPGIEPGSPTPEARALTIRPQRRSKDGCVETYI